MNFLIDNALSPAVAEALSIAGHNAVHVRERGLHAAPDEVLFDWAAVEDRVLVSVDTDFTRILSQRHSTKPSLILFRRDWHTPKRQISAILANLDRFETALLEGSIVTFDRDRIRIRTLPLPG
jgi:predicted nuclease of predicted toxin-antitoxin system